MVVSSVAKMSAALFSAVPLLILVITVSGQDHLPQSNECGTLNPEFYYNQRNLSQIGEFPWMGRVQYENNQSVWYQCYSVLISKRFMVLNAACFEYEVQPVRVLFGDWNKENSDKKSDCDSSGRCAPVPKKFEIEESIIHPNYNSSTHVNNIALIKLREPVRYTEFIRPICLPTKDVKDMTFDNQILEVTGWFLDASLGQILAKSFARVVKLSTCESRMKNIYDFDKENSICALTCWENYVYAAGAALMATTVVDEEPANYYLIGLNVYGQAKCSPRNPHVYSRVDRYLDWIYENTIDETSLIMPRKSGR